MSEEAGELCHEYEIGGKTYAVHGYGPMLGGQFSSYEVSLDDKSGAHDVYVYAGEFDHLPSQEEVELLLAAAAGKMRSIEMYVGKAWSGGSSGEWWTEYVEIPQDTPEGDIDRVAKDAMISVAHGRGEEIAFCGVYNIPEVEEE